MIFFMKPKILCFQLLIAVSLLVVLSLVIETSTVAIAQGENPQIHVKLPKEFLSEKSINLTASDDAASETRYHTISGMFFTVYGDRISDGFLSSLTRYFIADNNGVTTELIIPDGTFGTEEGIHNLNHMDVTVEGFLRQEPGQNLMPLLVVSKITPIDGLTTKENKLAVTGTHPYISILCKFKDITTEPKTLAYFKGMYASTYPGLDHYWRELSYNNVNIKSSTAVGWFTLDHPKSYYVYDNNNDGIMELDWERSAKDCTAKADPTVNFANFRNGGINLMFNSDLDCCAWGGRWRLTLDGITQDWPMTWEPIWGYSWNVIISHEMGHTFGLPHTSGNGGESSNVWDVMGDGYYNCSKSFDPIYGCLGQHTNAFHKDLVGWIPASQKYTLSPNKEAYLKLEQLEYPSIGNFKLITIPINGSTTKFYTTEFRKIVGYDVKLPGSAVIIHKVDTLLNSPADVVDPDNNLNTWDEGAQWVTGEIFRNYSNRTVIAVLSEYATGTWLYVCSGNVPIPSPPMLNSPTNFTFTNDNTPTLSWKSVPYGFKSQIQLSRSNTFETVEQVKVLNPRVLKWTTSLLADGKYYWRVRNINVNNEYGSWSKVRRITIDTKSPAVPILLSPIDGTIVNGTPEYSWQAVPYSKYYQFAYANSSDFSDVVYVSPGITTLSFVPPTQEPGEYYWHVRSQDAAGNWSNWSTPWKITIY